MRNAWWSSRVRSRGSRVKYTMIPEGRRSKLSGETVFYSDLLEFALQVFKEALEEFLKSVRFSQVEPGSVRGAHLDGFHGWPPDEFGVCSGQNEVGPGLVFLVVRMVEAGSVMRVLPKGGVTQRRLISR
jgi:hypothetical protein